MSDAPAIPEEFTDGQELLTIGREKSGWLDVTSEKCSEWFSAILVKETRQALKSRHFLLTFFGTLLVVVSWAVLGVSYMKTYQWDQPLAMGPVLLYGFWIILGFPLVVIVPFTTFRSMVQEFEASTIELVSITTSRPYQIIAGKLGSSMLQIMIYMSVLAPCIAFTYLLRGIDIFQIAACLALGILVSFGLCVVGVAAAAGLKAQVLSTASSILLAVGLFFVYYIWCLSTFGLTFFPGELWQVTEPPGQVALWGGITGVITTAMLLFAAACAMVSFDTENRTTLIRCMMMVQQTCFLGFCFAIYSMVMHPVLVLILVMIACHYWLIMGTMMVSTTDNLSRRVRRSLPKTAMGKSFFSLFMPGPGRGYLFAVCNMVACGLTLWLGMFFYSQLFPDRKGLTTGGMVNANGGDLLDAGVSCGTAIMFGVLMLSIVYLIMRWIIRRRQKNRLVLGLLILVLVHLFLTFSGLILQYNVVNLRTLFTYWQAFNWYSMVREMSDVPNTTPEVWSSAALVLGVTLVCFTSSMWFIVKEFWQPIEMVPQRVLDEDEENRFQPPAPGESIEDIFAEPDKDSASPTRD